MNAAKSSPSTVTVNGGVLASRPFCPTKTMRSPSHLQFKLLITLCAFGMSGSFALAQLGVSPSMNSSFLTELRARDPKLAEEGRDVLGDAATDSVLTAWGEAYWALADILIGKEETLYAEAGASPA